MKRMFFYWKMAGLLVVIAFFSLTASSIGGGACVNDSDCLPGYICYEGDCLPVSVGPDQPCKITKKGKIVFQCESGTEPECKISKFGYELECVGKKIIINKL